MRISVAVRPWLARPAVHPETLVLACAAFVMLVGNGPFWHAALAGRSWHQPGTWGFSAALFVSITALYVAATALVSSRFTVRPLLTLVLLVSAGASYYIERYSVYLDRAMLANVLATNYKEARELVGLGTAVHVLLFGALPAALLWWPRLKARPLARGLMVRAGWVLAAAALGLGSMLLVFADFASLMRNNEEMRYLITPGNVVASFSANVWGRAKRPTQPKLAIGTDAKIAGAARARPTLFVLVVGETARSQNFSLNGYARQTNPELARRNVISFPDAVACGTSTEVSLPCMFSPYGRSRYDEEKIQTHESVLNVLARAGVQVLWRDNQSGCKGVCDGLPIDQLDHAGIAPFCTGDTCLDEVLLSGMDQVLRDRTGNLLVVMHQLGSHGPAYFKRYPPSLRRFQPDCRSEDLRLCSSAEIVNAYDNSLLYTDFFLGKVIDFLQQAQQTHDTAMLYVSDHGESLGEGGLFLHGMPYAIAPHVQTRVPFVLWMSPSFRATLGIDEQCLRGNAKPEAASHEQLFHTLLGVFGVQTSAYERRFDLFAPCRSH
ncbi:phosphoethanolamine transferase [Caenimonas terrae]|uniref:Phosphoethanolamine transferase n=1 Tax=Caenimonas terrae TaxID=696074 RepID=A0ABW0NHR6_9BURK